MQSTLKVSVIVACRNEEAFIGACLDSILATDYPTRLLEILVVDGMSTDATRQVIDNYRQRFPFVRLLDNPKRIAASVNGSALPIR